MAFMLGITPWPVASALLWIILIVSALYLARSTAHKAIEAMARAFHRGFRTASRAVARSQENLAARNLFYLYFYGRPGPLIELVPTQLASKGLVITQFDLGSIERLGLVKIDLLGIRGLTVVTNQAVYIQGDYNSDASNWKPAGSAESKPIAR